jgi:hypothetical protein
MKSRSWLLWVIAILITLVSAVYQRVTGPTYPLRGQVKVGPETIKFRLLRSSENPGDAEVSVTAPDPGISGSYEFRRHPSDDPWTLKALERKGDLLVGAIPSQPASGKVIYRIILSKPGIRPVSLTDDPVAMRFKGHVPRIPILYPHILLMFVGMLCSTRAGLEALARNSGTFKMVLWTMIPLFLGGIVLGPIVQKFAFGAYWTGWPVGTDLTDNKTAVAMVFWLIALWRLRNKPESRIWVIAAAVITLVVFAIPHSVLGSEIDYTQTPK